MSELNFLHSGGNKVTLTTPTSNPASNVTFKLPQADGSAGDLLKTDGSGALSFGTPFSNKNIIVNGAMTVSQRATSASFTSGAVFPALDRFRAVGNSSMTVNTTISQTADSPDGLGYCYKVLVNASQTPTGSENFIIRYSGEEQDIKRFGYGTSACKEATISFSVKSNKTGLYSLQVYLGSYLPNIIVTYTINSANTWERKTITLPTYTTSFSHNADNAIGLMIDWHLSDGPDDIVSTTGWQTAAGNARAATGQVNLLDATNNYWQMTNVQFEVGDTATSFEHLSFGDELARCQRYYCKSYNYDVAPGTNTMVGSKWGRNYSADSRSANVTVVNFPVTMRDTPTVTFRGIHSGTAGKWTTGASNPNNSNTDVNVTSLYDLGQNGWTSMATSDIGSENFLGGHFEAESEI